MANPKSILEFAERLIYQTTDTYCSELQRRILLSALGEERKTYDQLADECGYSARYVKQDVAPKLWQLLTQAINEKVTKSNAQIVLESARSKNSPPASGGGDGQRTAMPSVDASMVTALTDDSSLSKHTILLVDDQPENLRLLSDLLDEQGYEVQQSINGEIALRAIAKASPDLILLDINLPDMDGYAICQQLRSNPDTVDIPIIFVSALDEPWDKVKAFSSGGSDYISKPFKVVEVLARVENQLKIQQLQQQLKAQNAQLKQAIKELQRLAAIDELTQVASRRRFDSYLSDCWKTALQSGSELTLILAQVANFNFYSEGKNPKVGDVCLYQIAQKIKQGVQDQEDLVARYGTLTFAVILPGKSEVAGIEIAEVLQQKIRKLKTPAGCPSLSLSIGVSSASNNFGEGLGALLESCTQNLQAAKQHEGDAAIVGT